jgi:hypothetical protein
MNFLEMSSWTVRVSQNNHKKRIKVQGIANPSEVFNMRVQIVCKR